jgi:hypothetical protein
MLARVSARLLAGGAMANEPIGPSENTQGDGPSLDAGAKVALALLALGALIALALLAAVALSLGRSRRSAPERQAAPFAYLDQKELGEAAARVNVLALLPLRTDCHEPAIRYLLRVVESCPAQVRVRFVNRRTPHGEKELERQHLKCASILINGQTAFQRPDGKTVKLEGGPDEQFTLADLREVLQRQVEAAYVKDATALPPLDAAEAAERDQGPAP